MKRRARRATLGAAALVAGLVGVLVIVHWDTVRDHLQAWHFQLTRETETIELYRGRRSQIDGPRRAVDQLLLDIVDDHIRIVANAFPWPMIFDPEDWSWWELPRLSAVLEQNGWRVLEQRFPRRAYIVICENQ